MLKKVDAHDETGYNSRPKYPMTHHDPGIAVFIPDPLRDCCAGAAVLAVPGTNLRGILEELERQYPALHRSICDETGAVRRHINLFVNSQHMGDRDGLDTKLAPGDEVFILPAVSGG